MNIKSNKNNTKKQKRENRKESIPKIKIYAIFCHIIHGAIVAMWTYAISLVMMTYFIPIIAANMANGMGITYESKWLDIIGLWGMPCMFMILLFLYITVTSIKMLHKYLQKNFEKSIKKHYLEKQTKNIAS